MMYSILLDVLLLVLMMMVAYRSYKQGLIAALIKVIGTVASYVLAALFSGPISDWIYEKFLQRRIVQMVSDRLPSELQGYADTLSGAGGYLGQIKGVITRALAENLENISPGLPFFTGRDSAAMAESVVEQVEGGASLAQAIADAAVRPMATFLLGIGVFFVILTVVMFLVRVFVRMGRGVNKVPLLGGVNRLGGLALGLLYAAAMGYALALGLALVTGITGNKIPFLTTHILEGTYLVRFLLHFKFVII